jgi:hypothetical protein
MLYVIVMNIRLDTVHCLRCWICLYLHVEQENGMACSGGPITKGVPVIGERCGFLQPGKINNVSTSLTTVSMIL